MSPPASARETPFAGEVELRFRYDADLVDDLKETIPARYRRYDPDEKRWLVSMPYTTTAIHLLLDRFPTAEVPAVHKRPAPKRERVRILPPSPPTVAEVVGDAAPLLAGVVCPRCGERREVPVRVVVHTGETVATREVITPELLSICPHCCANLVIAFFPAPESVRVAS